MLATLYSTAADPREANKQLTPIASNIPCKPSEPCTMIEPRVILNYSSAYNALNYIYLSDFDAYYFAEKTLLPGGELLLTCKLDPLMTFELDDIAIMCIRSESAGTNFAPDTKLPVDPNKCFLTGVLFPQQPMRTLEADNYLLTVNGGGGIS